MAAVMVMFIFALFAAGADFSVFAWVLLVRVKVFQHDLLGHLFRGVTCGLERLQALRTIRLGLTSSKLPSLLSSICLGKSTAIIR